VVGHCGLFLLMSTDIDWRGATDPWVRIRSVTSGSGLIGDSTDPWDRIRSRFYLFPIGEGVIFWTRGPGSGLECHKYYFFCYGADWVQTLEESVRRSIDSTGWLMGQLYLVLE
jgi:hypothetical protein